MKYNILVVDDNKQFVESINIALKNFHIIKAFSIEEAKNKINSEIDLVLLDLVFDENNPDYLQGLEFLPYIHKNFPDLIVVIMTNYPSKDKIVESIKSGAEDFFIKKELDWSEWEKRIENYCRNSQKIRELKTKTKELEERYDDTEIIGVSPEIEFVKRKLRDIAQHSDDITVFIQGETGTGKNLAVKYFKKHSKRKDKPYKEFSIFELSDSVLESELFGHIKGSFTGADKDKIGLFESANGGILFLDEIGDYDLKTQKKIMRFMEDKTISPVGSTKSKKLDLQLIMATNQDIPELIKKGRFREDLYQRINRIKIDLPSLKERREDIKILTDYFFNHFRVKEKTNLKVISNEVYDIFYNYQWPGNVRELQSVIWEACTNARLYNDSILTTRHLRKELISKNSIFQNESDNLAVKKAELELEAIDKALSKTYGKKAEAAKLLGMNADQMRYRVLKYFKEMKVDFGKFKNIRTYYG